MKKVILILLCLLPIILSGCQNTDELKTEEETEKKIPITEEVRPILPLSELPVYEYETEEVYFNVNGQTVFGLSYIPRSDKPVPVIILSHGLGGNYSDANGYGEVFASHGIAAVTFDFRGGGGRRSDGKTTEMSVLTEVRDLETVLETVRTWNYIDSDKIVLLGASHGGLVSAIVAADHPQEVAGLILTYPAFNVSDVLHGIFNSPEEVPETYTFGWITLGRAYAADFWDYDIFSEIGKYDKKVLLLHGENDPVVDPEYSDKAAQVYHDVEYYIILGAEHGFYGESFNTSLNYIFEYLQEIGIL